ncbi:MAG TPA: 4-hydroxy-3-methylbut-2-enyl diphosphate reductase, partial [Candidatus Lachnoclostridium pullistercoris]|nr:4-hydroxy-3-methylbut-2-enyl diphosphate reductase [Candidatus Lachnoclostridium pullistercoris]
MEIFVAKTAGFCFGVKRAVEKVYEQTEKGEHPIYTYGPIIHNEEVVKDLERRGVAVLETEEELGRLTGGVVVIRSHGVSRHVYELLASRPVRVVDATCPFVRKIHRIVEEQTAAGRKVVIIGNAAHPEVEGIKGWGNDDTLVVDSAEEVEKIPFPPGTKVCIVSQTTFNYNKFKELVEKFSEKRYDILVLNTICNATQERQAEAKEVA